jgi:hypothetical protein
MKLGKGKVITLSLPVIHSCFLLIVYTQPSIVRGPCVPSMPCPTQYLYTSLQVTPDAMPTLLVVWITGTKCSGIKMVGGGLGSSEESSTMTREKAKG